jgi:ADP-heptose:LPS heptosyltransferase
MKAWKDCENILCIRADNMGDVLMSGPAIKALYEYINCKITLLTSSKGEEVAKLNPYIATVITTDLPWVKLQDNNQTGDLVALVETLKGYKFDACVIFTVYSQNPLPAAMLAYMAGIPLRLAYCRENPYSLLNYWCPDPEPLEKIKHQVQRDLDLVANIGAKVSDQDMYLKLPAGAHAGAFNKMAFKGFKKDKPYLILHPGVSEPKRKYTTAHWISCGIALAERFDLQLVITGSEDERTETEEISKAIGRAAISAAGLLNLAEFAAFIAQAAVVVSVNTGTVHLAAALKIPVVVLYALSNPQHTPWRTRAIVLNFSIADHHRSKNKVIAYVDRKRYTAKIPIPEPAAVVDAVTQLLTAYNASTFLNTNS